MFCVFLCRVTDIKTLLSQHWETRRNCLRRKNVAQFCNNQNSRDGRCVCVQCPFLSPSIMKNLPNDLIPDPLFQRSHGILTTCSSCPTSSEFDTHTHTHAHSRNNKHGAAAALWCLDSLLLQVSASQFDFLSVQLADLKNDLSQNVPVK